MGCDMAGKGVKIMIMVDAKGLPVAVNTGSASPHESRLVEPLFDFMISVDFPEKLIGDKAYDSDGLDRTMAGMGVEMISPHRANRKAEHKTQDGRKLRRYNLLQLMESRSDSGKDATPKKVDHLMGQISKLKQKRFNTTAIMGACILKHGFP